MLNVAAKIIKDGQSYNPKPWRGQNIFNFMIQYQDNARASMLFINGNPCGVLIYRFLSDNSVLIQCISGVEVPGVINKHSVVKKLVGYFEDKFYQWKRMKKAYVNIGEGDPDYAYLGAFSKWQFNKPSTTGLPHWHLILDKEKKNA